MTTPPLHNTDEQRVDEVLYSFAKYVRHHHDTALGGVGMNQAEAKSAILSLLAEAREDELQELHKNMFVHPCYDKTLDDYLNKRIEALLPKESK